MDPFKHTCYTRRLVKVKNLLVEPGLVNLTQLLIYFFCLRMNSLRYNKTGLVCCLNQFVIEGLCLCLVRINHYFGNNNQSFLECSGLLAATDIPDYCFWPITRTSSAPGGKT